MAEGAEYPLLVLPAGVQSTPKPPPSPKGGVRDPSRARQIERLGPRFLELQRVLDAHAALISENAAATAPEHILVFETNGARKEFVEALKRLPDLEWLLQHDEQVEPDDDFHHPKEKDRDKEVGATFYLVGFNQKALQQLLGAWELYRTKDRLPNGLGSWRNVFSCLREIRRWGPEDRLREAGLLSEWLEPIDARAAIPVEIELWPRGSDRARVAESTVSSLVVQSGGRVLHTASIPEVRYHAVLAELPRDSVRALLRDKNVGLVLADDVFLFRAVPQCAAAIDPADVEDQAPQPSPLPNADAVCALLDGLPMENHPHLAGRLIVDDPDGWGATYPVNERRHGTAMASLILHGDLHAQNPPLPTPLHVQPILRPSGREENAPRHRLWTDVIHQAVRRMLAGDGMRPATAPGVRVINLSVGDRGRPFLFEISPLARLLDWLAWRYQVLFIVSAGNHGIELPDNVRSLDEEVIRHLFRGTRQRRILCPAESLNALTVGSLNHDGDGAAPPAARRIVMPTRTDVPAAYSALGRGFRRGVKPDVLMPGGRQLFEQPVPTSRGVWRSVGVQTQIGQRVAVPGPPGRALTTKTIGTSNAAALVSRSATFIHEAARDLYQRPEAVELRRVPIALTIKTLLVHSAIWIPEGASICRQAIATDVDSSRLKDHLAGLLGYGALRPERGLGGAPTRATAVGGGVIGADQRIVHALPIPNCLQAQTAWRRVTLTLAWFTPINAGDRRYRIARLKLEAPRKAEPLNVGGGQVHVDTQVRGTVQHVVLEASGSAILVTGDATIAFAVACTSDAGELREPVPYAIAVSLETAPETRLPIYDEIVERLRPRAPVRPRAP